MRSLQHSPIGNVQYTLQRQLGKGGGSTSTPPPPPKQGQTAAAAASTTARVTKNTGKRSTILTGQTDSLGDRIKALLGG